MQKNVASQKWIVFAFDETDNTPKTGDAAQITAEISADGAAGGGNITDTNPTELEDGYYVFDITAGESDADLLLILPESTTPNIQVIGVPGSVYTTEPNRNKLSIDSDGRTDIIKVAGTTQSANDNSADINDILTDTDNLQTSQGAWATATGFETSGAAAAALVAIKLDHLLNIAVDTNLPTTVHDNSVVGYMLAKANVTNYNRTEDSGEGRTDYGDSAWLTAMNVNVVSEDNIDFGALKKTSLNAATPDLSAITGDKASYMATGYAVSGEPLTALEVEDAVWDAVLTGISHDDATSAGKRLRQIHHTNVLREEEQAQGGTSSTITLHNDASAIDGFYDDAEVIITGDTGIGQSRHIHSYNGGTRVASISPDWKTDPDNTSDYVIMADSEKHVHEIDTDGVSAAALSSGAVDKIWAKAMSDLAGIPGATASVLDAVNILFMALRNKQTATDAQQTIANNAGATIATAVLSDAAGTTTKEEYA